MTVQLMCPFDFAYVKSRFSHDAAQIRWVVVAVLGFYVLPTAKVIQGEETMFQVSSERQ